MKQKIGIFGLSITLVAVTFGIFDHLRPAAIQAMVLIASAMVILAIYLAIRSMIREMRVLTAYDLELQQICPTCGYDLRATPERCPECGADSDRPFDKLRTGEGAEAAVTAAEKT